MAVAERFWNTLLDNVVLMICLLPLIGAVLVLLSSRLGVGYVRQTALTNVVMTFLLSLLMIAHYNPAAKSREGQAADIQMTSVFRWIGPIRPYTKESNAEQQRTTTDIRQLPRAAPGRLHIDFAVGVDGISLWPIALAALMMIPAVVTGCCADHKHPAAFYALLLVEQSVVMVLFAALDIVLFCVCLQLILVPMYFLIGMWGGYQRRRVVGKFLLFNMAGGLLMSIALLSIWLIDADIARYLRPSTAEAAATLSIPRLTGSFLTTVIAGGAIDEWNRMAPGIFAVFVMGLAVRVPAFPFHTWFMPFNAEAPLPVSLLFSGLFLLTGFYGAARFVVPLFSQLIAEWAFFLQVLAVAGATYFGLSALAQTSLKGLVSGAYLCALSLCAAGILSLNQTGVTGGLLNLCGTGLSMCVALIVADMLEANVRMPRVSLFVEPTQQQPGLRVSVLLATLALIGIPGFAGFAGISLTLLGLFAVNPVAAVGGMFAWLLIVWAVVRMFGRLLWQLPSAQRWVAGVGAESLERSPQCNAVWGLPTNLRSVPVDPSDPQEVFEPCWRGGLVFQRAILIPLFVVIVWVGLFPQFFISRIEPSVLRMLRVLIHG
jgi:NADH-quinone oxidoreductase subunit M